MNPLARAIPPESIRLLRSEGRDPGVDLRQRLEAMLPDPPATEPVDPVDAQDAAVARCGTRADEPRWVRPGLRDWGAEYRAREAASQRRFDAVTDQYRQDGLLDRPQLDALLQAFGRRGGIGLDERRYLRGLLKDPRTTPGARWDLENFLNPLCAAAYARV